MDQVVIRGESYKINKIGRGTPCLSIGIGTLLERTMPKKFYDDFEVYYSDLYWVKDETKQDTSKITFDTILDDIKELSFSLNLPKFTLLAHSAYGIVALEFAKKYPDLVNSIIIIGTPLNSNPEVAAHNNAIFEEKADEIRKKIDQERRAEIAAEDLSLLTPSERFQREYIYRDAPRYWHIPDYDCTHLWQNLFLDKLIERFFAEILPKIDVRKTLESIQIPIFHAIGLSDFDCCPWVWKDVPNLPPKMSFAFFDRSGHWPHFEEPEAFIEAVRKWKNS